MTHTYAILPVSKQVYEEVKRKLIVADYKHVFSEQGLTGEMDMHGIALQDDGTSTSDGYHTFDELYEHRIELFLAVCRIYFHLNREAQGPDQEVDVWMSNLHSDGSAFPGWFIVGIGTKPGEQVTYHLPLKYWDEAKNWCLVRETAPEYDGHTPADVLKRLRTL